MYNTELTFSANPKTSVHPSDIRISPHYVGPKSLFRRIWPFSLQEKTLFWGHFFKADFRFTNVRGRDRFRKKIFESLWVNPPLKRRTSKSQDGLFVLVFSYLFAFVFVFVFAFVEIMNVEKTSHGEQCKQ